MNCLDSHTPMFPRVAPSFDEPIDMIEACHIEDQLATLERLAEYLPAKGCDAEAQVGRFAWPYRRHRAAEATVLLPFAREAIAPEEREAIGRRMAERRGAARMKPG